MSETRSCQNCSKDFVIEPEDFDFYKKIHVPAPTFCPDCRFQRRLMFRNERTLYKRSCDLCQTGFLSIMNPDKGTKVLCGKCWWGDAWDQYEHGMDYDPSRSFFEQFKELQYKNYWMDRIVDHGTLVNSDYINHAGDCKDCYLIYNADHCQNVLYSTVIVHTTDAADCTMVGGGSLQYELVGGKGTQLFFSEGCSGSSNLTFCKDCINCTDCFGCINLRNKSYCIWNEQYTKEEYEKRIAEYKTDRYSEIQKLRQQAYEFWLQFPRKYYHGFFNVDSSGEYVFRSKNSHFLYQSMECEDSKYCQYITIGPTKDCYDYTEWGMNSERVCDSITVGENCSDIKYCFGSWGNTRNNEYCMIVPGSEDCFGCVNLKKGKYCILNKQYSKEEYEKLREQIINDMNEHPYIDSKSRVWKYGEFFPYDLSMFDYNESHAASIFPLDKEKATANGFRWQDERASSHQITLPVESIPDSIHDIDDSVLREILGCSDCGKVYRIVAAELELLKRFKFPIPRKCPDCRHMDRLARINPPQLWKRVTEDGVEVMTAYAPDRPEKIYSEEGYNNLVN